MRVAPIKLETCRCGLNRVPVEQRLRDKCNLIKDESHVLIVYALGLIAFAPMLLMLLLKLIVNSQLTYYMTIYPNDVKSIVL